MKELFTRSYDVEWGRIVELCVEDGKSMSDYINDKTTCKVIVLKKGELELESAQNRYTIKAPSCILLNNSDEIEVIKEKSIEVSTLFLQPVVVREEFAYDRINSDEFNIMTGRSIYQDYILVYNFRQSVPLEKRIFEIPFTALHKITGILKGIDNELIGQLDGFWPCRSRSLLLELLYFIAYSFVFTEKEETVDEDAIVFTEVIDYFHEHISEQIALNDITRRFSINRNKLNAIFTEKTKLTCLSYLLKMRIDLAKIMLSKTEIPVGEVSARVGYTDANYFSKVFKKQTEMSPVEYRREYS